MTQLPMPATTATWGQQSYVVLSSAPASLTAITAAELTAGENVSCYLYGDWFPTADTEGVSRARKACQTQVTQAKGNTTWQTPPLSYSANPQTIDTPGSAGNEAYEVFEPDSTVYVVKFIGVPGDEAPGAADAYQVLPLDLGPRVWAPSQDDAGGEASINQAAFFAPGYSAPVDGVVAA